MGGRPTCVMSETFQFSPRSNRAHEIAWRAWGTAAFDEAAREDRPILLNLTATWCHWCHLLDETTFSEPDIIALIQDALVPVRVDADRYPHVQDRYIAGGWPTTAFLTATGEVLWAGTYIDAEAFRSVAASVITAWRERREELNLEIERRRRAMEAARGHSIAHGIVRREAADDVLTSLRDSFDARNGGFGSAPKFPQAEAIELMYAQAGDDAAWQSMADRTLDGMLAGELWDAVDGGFFRYALAADWTQPRQEKLLDVNAGLLEAYALGAALRVRSDWRDIAERLVVWVDTTLRQPTGLWASSQSADPEYFAASAAARRKLTPPRVDDTIYTVANARWIAALARAGARLSRSAWIDAAAHALQVLHDTMRAPGGGLFHFRERTQDPRFDFLLADTLEVARAALAVAQATGDAQWLELARTCARHVEKTFWAEGGGFWDRTRTDHDVGALRYQDCPFELNASAARLLLDLTHVTGERSWRALAERTLARLSPLAGRYGASGASFALATEEFFDPPVAVIIATPTPHDATARELRRVALALPRAQLRVWTVPHGHVIGRQRFDAADAAVAYVCSARGCSPAIPTTDALAVTGIRAR